jgi:hypothetical protein
VELKSLETPTEDARARPELTEFEAARARTPSGADGSWLRWIIVAILILIIIGFAIASWGTRFR